MPRGKTAEAKKDELEEGLRAARQQLLDAVAAVPAEQASTPFIGAWSANELVAHLIGWDCANLAAIDAVVGGRLPEFYAAYDKDWRTFNAELVARYRCATLAETVAEARISHAALLAALDRTPAEAVVGDHGVRSPRGRRVTVAMLLTAETNDERVHCEQVRAFVAQQRGLPAVE